MPSTALDIGTYSIKALVGSKGPQPDIERSAEIFNTVGVVLPADQPQLDKLVEMLGNFIRDNNIPTSDLRVALPETVVSTKVISLPNLSDAELASAIHWQAEQYIPIPPEELSLEFQVLYRPPKNDKNTQMKVLLVGVRKPVIERFLSVFTALGLEPSVLETQMLSAIRALKFESTDPATLLVNLGASTLDMALMSQGLLEFVITHISGGQMLTRALQQAIGLDPTQAESYKRTYGMDAEQFQGKVRDALFPTVKVMVNEMSKAIRFFNTQHPNDTVKRIVLMGGGAQLPSLVMYITQELGMEVLVASPFAEATGAIPENNHPAYTVSVGLLMREG